MEHVEFFVKRQKVNYYYIIITVVYIAIIIIIIICFGFFWLGMGEERGWKEGQEVLEAFNTWVSTTLVRISLATMTINIGNHKMYHLQTKK